MDGFPGLRLKGTKLYRIHWADREPWWFSNDGTGRFDLPKASGHGTCYLATDAVGCFLEVFRYSNLLPETEVEFRRISQIEMSEIHLADCTSGLSRMFGITGEIHSTSDYSVTQRWAAGFAQAGFDGIYYLLRHDPGQRLAGVALFGPAGLAPWPATPGKPIGPEILTEAEHRFGIRVRPPL